MCFPKTLRDGPVQYKGANLQKATQKVDQNAADTWTQSREALLPRGPPVQGTKQDKGGRKSAKPTVIGQEQGSITRVYHVIQSQPGKNKQERKLSRGEIHTWELPYGPCPAKHRETREKRKWKKDWSVTETNKIKILFKKNKLTMIQPFQCQKAWNSKDGNCHDCRRHDSTHRTKKIQGR